VAPRFSPADTSLLRRARYFASFCATVVGDACHRAVLRDGPTDRGAPFYHPEQVSVEVPFTTQLSLARRDVLVKAVSTGLSGSSRGRLSQRIMSRQLRVGREPRVVGGSRLGGFATTTGGRSHVRASSRGPPLPSVPSARARSGTKPRERQRRIASPGLRIVASGSTWSTVAMSALKLASGSSSAPRPGPGFEPDLGRRRPLRGASRPRGSSPVHPSRHRVRVGV